MENAEKNLSNNLQYSITAALLEALAKVEKQELEKIVNERKRALLGYVTPAERAFFWPAPKYPQINPAEAEADFGESIAKINDLEKRTLAFFAGVKQSILTLMNSTK